MMTSFGSQAFPWAWSHFHPLLDGRFASVDFMDIRSGLAASVSLRVSRWVSFSCPGPTLLRALPDRSLALLN